MNPTLTDISCSWFDGVVVFSVVYHYSWSTSWSGFSAARWRGAGGGWTVTPGPLVIVWERWRRWGVVWRTSSKGQSVNIKPAENIHTCALPWQMWDVLLLHFFDVPAPQWMKPVELGKIARCLPKVSHTMSHSFPDEMRFTFFKVLVMWVNREQQWISLNIC